MDKEVVVHILNGIYSAIKRNIFESVLMRWMKLEPIIQSELSQKEKYQSSIQIAYIWNLERCNHNPVYESAKETQMCRTVFGLCRRGWGQNDMGEWH